MKLRLIALASVLAVIGCTTTGTEYDQTIQKAATNQNSGDFVQAEHYHRIAVDQMRAAENVPTKDLALQLSNHASALNQLNRPAEAEVLLLQAADILAQESSVDPFTARAVAANLAQSCELQGRLDEAENLYNQSLDATKSFPDWQKYNGFQYIGLANIYAWRNDEETASRYYLKAELLYQQLHGPNSTSWVRHQKKYRAIWQKIQVGTEP